MKKLSSYALIYLLLIFFFTWGLVVGKFEIFPYKLIRTIGKEIINLYKNDDKNKEISVLDRLKNDLGFFPNKHLVEYSSNLDDFKIINLNFDKRRTSKPFIKNQFNFNEKLMIGEGYLLIQGLMDFKSALYGSILIDLEGKLINKWEYKFFELSDKKKSLKNNYNTHPVVILNDGSLVYTINDNRYGLRIIRQSFCGEVIWSKEKPYHHSISLDHNENLWTSNAEKSFVLLNKDNGEIIKEILLKDVFEKNRNLGIFNFHINLPENNSITDDPFHLNDVEPLKFNTNKFKKGDLLISFRNSNLVFVLDQNSLDVKWWTIGNTIRQHDPDWHQNYITIFDNSMRNNELLSEKKFMSRIVRIDPVTNKSKVLYDGDKHNAYSVIRGNHQIINDKFILSTISSQGRALILDNNENLKFEFVNKYNKTFNGILMEAIWMDKDYFNFNIENYKCD